MKRNLIQAGLLCLLIGITLSFTTNAIARAGNNQPAAQSSLPHITFLGEGPNTFTVQPPLKFLIKTYQNGEFLFITQDGPTYQAKKSERVWTTDFVPTESIRLFHQSKNYGNFPAGCVINYVQIEDNIDTRRNTFYLNGQVLQVVDQGMVTYGSVTLPEAGALTFYAEDSIGMIIEPCTVPATPLPSESPTAAPMASPTVTAAPSGTAAATDAPSATPTAQATTFETPMTPTATGAAVEITPTQPTLEGSPTPTVTLSATAVVLPSSTPTLAPTQASTEPSNSPTQTPAAAVITATSTSSPVPSMTPASIVITATPVSTPSQLPVTGGTPGPSEVAVISGVILVLFGLIAAAWWCFLRAYTHAR